MRNELIEGEMTVAIFTEGGRHETAMNVSGDGIGAVHGLADSLGKSIIQADVYCLGVVGFSLFMSDDAVILAGSTNTLDGGVSLTSKHMKPLEFLDERRAFEPLPIVRDVLGVIFRTRYQE